MTSGPHLRRHEGRAHWQSPTTRLAMGVAAPPVDGPGPRLGGHVRFPPENGPGACNAGIGVRRSRPLLRGGKEQGSALRRLVLLRRHVDRDLLPSELSGPDARTRASAVLRHCGRGAARWLPRLSSLPSRRHAGLTRMGPQGRRGGAGHAPDPRRRGGPRRCRGSGSASGLQLPTAAPADDRGDRHWPTGRGQGATQSDCPHPVGEHRPSRGRHRVRRGLRERPTVQRHVAPDLRRHAAADFGRGQRVLDRAERPGRARLPPTGPPRRSGSACRAARPSARRRCSDSWANGHWRESRPSTA